MNMEHVVLSRAVEVRLQLPQTPVLILTPDSHLDKLITLETNLLGILHLCRDFKDILLCNLFISSE